MNPNLLKVHPSFVYREVARSVSLGLSLDPQLGEAYLIVRRNDKNRREEVHLQTGYRGLIRLARQSGLLTVVYASAVHEGDIFEIEHGATERLRHVPDIFNEDRGEPVGYYAVMHFHDGSYDFEPLTLREIHRIRDGSDAYRAFKSGRIKSTPWSEWFDEMAKKTALRRLLKRAPMSAEAVTALAEEETEEEEIKRPPRVSSRRQLDPPAPEIENDEDEGGDLETKEKGGPAAKEDSGEPARQESNTQETKPEDGDPFPDSDFPPDVEARERRKREALNDSR
jgi:recombination protein RecT